MGAGIAQLAASAGHQVLLFDAGEGAAQNGKAKIGQTLERLVTKGKMTAEDTDALLSRIAPVKALADLSGAALVIEAIIEDLNIKRGLFADLEAIVGPETILATNTSSLSVTAIARDLLRFIRNRRPVSSSTASRGPITPSRSGFWRNRWPMWQRWMRC